MSVKHRDNFTSNVVDLNVTKVSSLVAAVLGLYPEVLGVDPKLQY
jgi:hypothetical protein